MKVFAHRGISALFPENSQSAIEACDDQPFEGIEIDLYQVEDEFFVLHDRWLTRLFGINKHVNEFTAEEMSALRCKDGKPVPTLDWLFAQLSQNALTLNIELKQINDISLLLETIHALCHKYTFDNNRLLFSSFNHNYIQSIALSSPQFKLGLLLSAHPIDVSKFLSDFAIYSVHIDIDCLSEQLIKDIHQHNLQVFVFTVDHQSEIEWLKSNKVDAIFANNPLQAYKFIN